MAQPSAHVRLEDGGTFSVAYEGDEDDDASGVDSLWVKSSCNFVAFNRASWLSFVQAFRQTPSLERLFITGSWNEDPTEDNFSVETLTQIIEAVTFEDPTKIKSFCVLSKTLVGAAGPDDGWERFNQCIQSRLCALEDFHFEKHRTNNEDEEPQLLEPMVQTIFSLPTLQSVDLKVPGLSLSPATLERLGRCQNLQQVDILEMVLKDEQIMALSNALLSTRSLGHLKVQISSQLEDAGACGSALSGMLQDMPGVMIEAYSSSPKLQDEFDLAFVDVMAAKDSIGIGNLTFYFSLSKKALNAYMKLAKENYTFLTNFWCHCKDKDSDFYRALQFNLALNKAGRAKVIPTQGHRGEASREEWVDIFIRNNEGVDDSICENFDQEEDRLSLIFYFLSQNPSLCEYSNDNYIAPLPTMFSSLEFSNLAGT